MKDYIALSAKRSVFLPRKTRLLYKTLQKNYNLFVNLFQFIFEEVSQQSIKLGKKKKYDNV